MPATAPLLFAFAIIHSTVATSENETVFQSERQIPVARCSDVVVIGGSLGAVAAAIEAREAGASVLLVTPRSFLGDDLCGTLQLWLEQDEQPRGKLVSRLFPDPDTRVTTPLKVKRTLEAAMLAAHVDFLLGCYPTDVLCDEAGQCAGVVIANRAGRQAIVAKTIIDATQTGTVARIAGAPFRKAASGFQICRRVVLGGKPSSRTEPTRTVPAGIAIQNQALAYYVYERIIDTGVGDFSSWAEAEQQMRDDSYRDGQLRASERIQVLPNSLIHGRISADEWTAGELPDLGHFQVKGLERMYVLSGAADVPRSEVDSLLRPEKQERVGGLIGRAAAREAANLGPPDHVRVKAGPVDSRENDMSASGSDVSETLTGLRPTGGSVAAITAPATRIPVLANVDVVVAGGGTSGACAAIAAARHGAHVVVVEYQEGLGGVGTLGLIGKPYHGLNRGFTSEVPFPNKDHNAEYKMEWFRRQIRQAGGRIWLGVLGCGVYTENNRVCGAVVATPLGRGAVLARVVIDATGNADIAVAAGADSMYGGDSTVIAMQGSGLPRRPLTGSYVNTDYLLVDESDMVDTWRAFVGMRLANEIDDYDVAPFIQTRERRRVVGDHVLSYLDQVAQRTYPDSIVLSGSDYDSHGYPSEPYFALIPHTHQTLTANHPAPGGTCYTPYRCLLPLGVEGMLVTGLGISMRRDASAMVRMQKDMHNQGYAAGIAATMAAAAGCTPREVDVRHLQQQLVQMGNLPESVLTDVDSFPLSQAQIQAAVERLTDTHQDRAERCKALAVILSHSHLARAPLRRAYRAAVGDARLSYAKLLGFLGEKQGVPDLLDALAAIDRWDPKILQGQMAEYAHLPTPVDALILALGYSKDLRALPAILDWLERLDADVTLSHHRSVALALEQMADPAAAMPLARLLKKPGMSGHAMTHLEPLYDRDQDRRRRTGPLREIELARSLYRCGDQEGLAERILTSYTHDIRGLFARHAKAVLSHR